MMVFPHFLDMHSPELRNLTVGRSPAAFADPGQRLGGRRRPPSVAYQPFVSAYNAVLQIINNGGQSPASAIRSTLELSFRLPPQIIELIARIYRPDQVELHGLERPPRAARG